MLTFVGGLATHVLAILFSSQQTCQAVSTYLVSNSYLPGVAEYTLYYFCGMKKSSVISSRLLGRKGGVRIWYDLSDFKDHSSIVIVFFMPGRVELEKWSLQTGLPNIHECAIPDHPLHNPSVTRYLSCQHVEIYMYLVWTPVHFIACESLSFNQPPGLTFP
jgi:hypothetical protein